jgi:hypothetical protein
VVAPSSENIALDRIAALCFKPPPIRASLQPASANREGETSGVWVRSSESWWRRNKRATPTRGAVQRAVTSRPNRGRLGSSKARNLRKTAILSNILRRPRTIGSPPPGSRRRRRSAPRRLGSTGSSEASSLLVDKATSGSATTTGLGSSPRRKLPGPGAWHRSPSLPRSACTPCRQHRPVLSRPAGQGGAALHPDHRPAPSCCRFCGCWVVGRSPAAPP